ncbi:protein kinase [Candidatus Margulisiibacteriota bacterium]
MKSINNLKSKYQVTGIYSEDLLSFTYSAIELDSKKKVIIEQYKKEYLTSPLIELLIKATEKLILIDQANILRPKDYYYDGKSFYVISPSPEKVINLEEFITKYPQISLKKLWKQTTQIISALMALEKNNLFHGNLNLNTVLITENLDVKLSKTHLHYLIYKTIFKQLEVIDYAIFYPPEFLLHQKYYHSSDIYSLGILLYVIFSNNWPYKYTSNIKYLKKALLADPLPFKKSNRLIPEKLSKVISLCIRKNPKDRITSFDNFVQIYRKPENIEAKLNLKVEKEENIVRDMKKSLARSRAKSIIKTMKYVMTALVLGIFFFGGYYFYLSYLTGIPDKMIPDVIGLERNEALIVLRDNKLNGVVAGKRYHPYIPAGQVISSRPPKDRLVKQNRIVKLFISEGTKKYIVPDLIGRNVDQAKQILPSYINLNIAGYLFSSQFEKGLIIKQQPTANMGIIVSENVNIYLSKGYQVEIQVSEVKPGFFQNKSNLRNINISFSILENWLPQEVTIYFNHKDNTEKLYSQHHFPADQVNLSFEVEYKGYIEIYFDGELGFKEQILDTPKKKNPWDISADIAQENRGQI